MSTETRCLSPSEHDRISRFRFEHDQIRYAISHVNLRLILSGYVGCRPHELHLSAHPLGKPFLISRAVPSLKFNLSHTSNIGVLAVAHDAEIGIDVEAIRPIERDIAQAHFSPRELADLDLLCGPQWLQGFYNCWTRKEAILKAEGIGLNPPLSAFDVSLLPDSPARLLRWHPSAQLTRAWNLIHLVPTPDTIAALAISSLPTAISSYSFLA